MTSPDCPHHQPVPLDCGRLAELARSRAGDRLIVLIDGRSGSGKTTLAVDLAERLANDDGVRPVLINVDDCCPGWHGLAAACRAVPAMLRPDAPGYRRYDWRAGRLAGWVTINPRSAVIIEGCGAITPASAALASLRIWVRGDERERRLAAQARDGDAVADWWDTWAAQEQQHLDADRPEELAEVIVDAFRGVMRVLD